MEKIILGGGCFWCTEAVFSRLNGVVKVTPGYSGGHTEHPDYRTISTGTTGHAEVILVEYNPQVISLDLLLEVFWEIHDPTTLNRQGADIGSQYRSVIYYYDESQKSIIAQSLERVSVHFDRPIVTQVEKAKAFYPAEPYHHDYYDRNGAAPYCRIVISPKIKKLETKFESILHKRDE